MKTKKIIWIIFLSSGILSVIFYTLHVVLGGMLWQDYNHITQAISDLTAAGAPDYELLRILTTIYGYLALLFSIVLLKLLWEHVSVLVKTGLVLLFIMEFCSSIGYGLFPLNEETAVFQNTMHILVTAFVVLCAIGSMFFTGIGFIKTPGLKKLGIYTVISGVIITLSGAGTGIITGLGFQFIGLIERVNIFTLQ
jgi:hypothetical protein